jgi:hypothetical protein
MKFEINVKRKHLLYTVFLVAIVGGMGLGVAFTTNPAGPNVMGHAADQIFCDGCIVNANIADAAAIAASKIAIPAGIWAGLNADQVDGLEGAALEESAEIDADIATHAASTDHDNLYVNVGEADSITGAMIQDGGITGADIADGTIPASKLAGGAGGTVTAYKLTASSYQTTGGSYCIKEYGRDCLCTGYTDKEIASKTVSYTCDSGDATMVFCTDAGKDINGNPYCDCSVSGSTATVKAYANKRHTRWWDSNVKNYRADSCQEKTKTTHCGGWDDVCGTVSCEMRFQCTDLQDVTP